MHTLMLSDRLLAKSPSNRSTRSLTPLPEFLNMPGRPSPRPRPKPAPAMATQAGARHGAPSRCPSWRPSGWNPNKAPAATKTSSLPACTKLLPLQARSTRRRSTGQGEACHALHVASHLAPRPPPSHSATLPLPRRSRKGVRDAAQRSPLPPPLPRIDGRPSSSPPPRTHTHTPWACMWGTPNLESGSSKATNTAPSMH